jgi:hypothetical protein
MEQRCSVCCRLLGDMHYIASVCNRRLCAVCAANGGHVTTSTEQEGCRLCNKLGCYWITVWPSYVEENCIMETDEPEPDNGTPKPFSPTWGMCP